MSGAIELRPAHGTRHEIRSAGASFVAMGPRLALRVGRKLGKPNVHAWHMQAVADDQFIRTRAKVVRC
jgi:hypothetical protein